MGTALYSLGPMQGARLWRLFWLAAAVCYLGVCLAVRANRTRRGLPAGCGAFCWRKCLWTGSGRCSVPATCPGSITASAGCTGFCCGYRFWRLRLWR